jgi:hypothetical protein
MTPSANTTSPLLKQLVSQTATLRRFSAIFRLQHLKHSYVIPSEVEGPLNCGIDHASRRGPSTALRMTTLGMLHPRRRRSLWWQPISGQNKIDG